MKPPNTTPPPAQVEQISATPAGASNTAKQLHPTKTVVNATISTQSQQPPNPNEANPTSTSAPATTHNATPTTNNSLPVTSSMALITTQPTILAKSSPHSSVTASASLPGSPITTTVLNSSQEQQAPLALTTQNQTRAHIQLTPTATNQIQLQQLPGHPQQTNTVPTTQIVTIASAPNPTSAAQSSISSQLAQIQSKLQPNQPNATIAATSPLTLATAPTAAGPTALVIIPQHSTAAGIAPSKPGAITSKTTQIPTTYTTTAAHIALASTTQPSTIQMQAPVATIVPNMAQVPMNAHQNSALVNRPPQSLPVVPIATTPNIVNAKHEQNRNTCCLFDNGIRCDRVAGNASFSARIQKIVGTKKMNFALDQSAKHSYICDHHKAIITVAKKMTTPARETKANARNFAANNNPNVLTSQHTNNYNDLSMNQTPIQHQMNLEMLSNQSRIANNHAAVMNTMQMRPGAQIAYGHYPPAHTNQMGSMDAMMVGKYDVAGGDSIASGSGGVDVDLQQLQVNTLRRYKRHFRVQTRPGLNKMQLAESLKHHFRTLPIIEKEAITYFVYIVKCSRNKLDHNPKAD